MVMLWLEGGQGEVRGASHPPLAPQIAPPGSPHHHPNSPNLDPPPTDPLGAPPPRPFGPPRPPPPPSAQFQATTKRGCRPWAESQLGTSKSGAGLLPPPPPPLKAWPPKTPPPHAPPSPHLPSPSTALYPARLKKVEPTHLQWRLCTTKAHPAPPPPPSPVYYLHKLTARGQAAIDACSGECPVPKGAKTGAAKARPMRLLANP